MIDDIIIRPATLADAAAISAVHRSTVDTWRDPITRHATSYAALTPFGQWYNGGPWLNVDLCTAHLNALLRRGHVPLVAEIEGTIAGEAEYFANREPAPFGPSLHLSILYIHKDWQRRGIGQRLVNAGVAEARRRAFNALTTQPEAEATDFYARAGFRPWRRAREMQIKAQGEVPNTLVRIQEDTSTPENLALQIGRYQCSPQGWDILWPTLPLAELVNMRRSLWHGTLAGSPAVLGIREQWRDPTQADGYAWLPPSVPLAPAVDALRSIGNREGFNAVDLLLPDSAIPDLKTTFRLDYQTTVDLWWREIP